MELLVGAIVLVTGLGALVIGAAGLILIWRLWFLAIPIIGLLCGGFFGLCFGLGIVVIIGVIVLYVQSQ